ncbi:hypothetical protein FRC03_002718 [Tulasnella sp. 419]|nr:hypothetical protein FRC03_002718 [Tulasnella sp. 419]
MGDNSDITKQLRGPHPAGDYAGYFQVTDPGEGPFYIWDSEDLKLRRNDHGDYSPIRFDDSSLAKARKDGKIQRDHVFEIQYLLKLFMIQLWEDKSSSGSFWFPPDTLEWISIIVNYPANIVIVPTDFHSEKTAYFRKGSSKAMSKDICLYLLDCQKLLSSRFEYIRGELEHSRASDLTKIIVNEFLDKMEQTPWYKPDVWEELAKSGKPWSLPSLVAEQSQTKLEESFICMLPPYSESTADLTAYCTHKGGCECLATMDKPHSRHRTVAVTLYLLVIVLSLNVATIFAIHVIRSNRRLSTSI